MNAFTHPSSAPATSSAAGRWSLTRWRPGCAPNLSLALLAGVGLYQLFGWWWADAVGALAMLPVIVWQGWETFGEAGEHDDHEDAADVH